ncbi:MAG: AbgT family transporter, partial [Bacteroidota bacterium]
VGLGVAYGAGAGTVKSDRDVIKGMSQQMSTLGGYMVLVFFAAQFVAFFNWTQLGLILAVNGAESLRALGLSAVPLFVLFILLTATVNLTMGSASAKWALMAPVFVPMFMLMGVSPEATQAAYRVGDSSTNMIAPLLSYIPLILVAMRRYVKESTLGTLLSLMLPYSISTAIVWTLFLLIYVFLGLPLGPGVSAEFIAP